MPEKKRYREVPYSAQAHAACRVYESRTRGRGRLRTQAAQCQSHPLFFFKFSPEGIFFIAFRVEGRGGKREERNINARETDPRETDPLPSTQCPY